MCSWLEAKRCGVEVEPFPIDTRNFFSIDILMRMAFARAKLLRGVFRSPPKVLSLDMNIESTDRVFISGDRDSGRNPLNLMPLPHVGERGCGTQKEKNRDKETANRFQSSSI